MKPSDLKRFFENGLISQDCLDGKEILIFSIADLLHICEDFKKGNLRTSAGHLKKRFTELADNPKSLAGKGLVYVADLDHDVLNKALFERENNIVHGFWSKATNSRIPPRRSIRYLTLRISDESVWWSEDVYLQMEQYHADMDR